MQAPSKINSLSQAPNHSKKTKNPKRQTIDMFKCFFKIYFSVILPKTKLKKKRH